MQGAVWNPLLTLMFFRDIAECSVDMSYWMNSLTPRDENYGALVAVISAAKQIDSSQGWWVQFLYRCMMKTAVDPRSATT